MDELMDSMSQEALAQSKVHAELGDKFTDYLVSPYHKLVEENILKVFEKRAYDAFLTVDPHEGAAVTEIQKRLAIVKEFRTEIEKFINNGKVARKNLQDSTQMEGEKNA